MTPSKVRDCLRRAIEEVTDEMEVLAVSVADDRIEIHLRSDCFRRLFSGQEAQSFSTRMYTHLSVEQDGITYVAVVRNHGESATVRLPELSENSA